MAVNTPPPSRRSRILSGLWYVVAVALIVWACIYLVFQYLFDPPLLIVYVVFLIGTFAMLLFGEGTEIVYALLIDKDSEQVPKRLRSDFEKLLRSDHVLFIGGRQLLVVFAIVGMTLTSEHLSHIVPRGGLGFLSRVAEKLAEGAPRHAFEILFPAFFAYWFAQLPSKLLAHDNPLAAYSLDPIRWVIGGSVWLGERLHVEGPSPRIKQVFKKFMAGSEIQLKPSRSFYYATSAQLRDGKGLEIAHIHLWIGKDGSVDVEHRIEMKAHALGFKEINSRMLWESKMKPNSGRLTINCPVAAAQNEPKFSGTERYDNKDYHGVSWGLTFVDVIAVGQSASVVANYSVEAGAMAHTHGANDDYEFNIDYVPTNEVVVEVHAKPDAGFMLINGRTEVEASKTKAVNDKEAEQWKPVSIPDGYRFWARYPLPKTKLTFSWTIAASNRPAESRLEGSQ